MDKKYINELADILVNRNLQEIEVINGENVVRLTAKKDESIYSYTPKQQNNLPNVNDNTSNYSNIKGTSINAPLVGTYYDSPNETAAAFVKIGDKVCKGATLFIIEAMKNMNEVVAPIDGIITDILITNGEMVDFGKTIMIME